MDKQNPCPGCGETRPDDAPSGLCPACLLKAGMLGDGSRLPDVTITFGPASSSVLARFGEAFGKIPPILLRDTDSITDPSPVIRPSSTEIPNPTERSARLQLFGEIARGGMGAVLKGRDADLGRDLAVKVLLDSHREKPEMVRRFIEEAQIAGQLQHPGIVPIYELGAFGDHRPYFAMKLVKGQTLAEILAARKAPSEALPRFLSIFESICQTMAYAHARGVIHRDLKPSNVMVGSFGEVQVMDWGLAKVLPRGGAIDDASAGKVEVQETVIATARSASDADLSQAGSVMGTPSHMAPEQARGEIDQIDERADVFALGSILCEILTGQSAFIGRTSGEIHRKAALGDLADALTRLESSGLDPELITLAKDCLSREPEDRPRDAGAVADRIASYLAGVQARLRKAEIDTVEERGRRRLTMAVAAAVLLFGLSGSGGYVWIEQQKYERQAKTARAVDEALAEAARLSGEARAAPTGETSRWTEALSAAKRAQGLLTQGEADAPLKERVEDLRTSLEREQAVAVAKARQIEADRVLLVELESVRGNQAEHHDFQRTDNEYAAAFRKAGLDLDKSEPIASGKWLAARTEPVELVGYLDDWAQIRQLAKRPDADWRRLVEAARGADPDPWRDALRARIADKNPEAAAQLRRLADDAKALVVQPASSLILLARQLKDAIGDRERAASVLRLAVFRYPADFSARVELADLLENPEEKVRHRSAALAIRPGDYWTHSNLGTSLGKLGKTDEAIAEYREAIRINPGYGIAHHNLGGALRDQGKFDEAVAECREAVRLMPDLAVCHYNLGLALMAQGKPDEAIAAYREAIQLKPDDPKTLTNLGLALSNQGKKDEAITLWREAIRFNPRIALAHNNLGNALKEQGKIDEALVEYREAIRLQPDWTVAHSNLGRALSAQGKQDQAVAEYREAIRLEPKLASHHLDLSILLSGQGKIDEAIVEMRETIRLQPENFTAYYGLGDLLKRQGKLDEAVAEYRRAIRINPRYAEAHCNLGDVLRRQGDFGGSLAAYRRGHELGSQQPGWSYPSAQWVAKAERLVLTERLPAILKGDDRPKDNTDRLAVARLCYDTKRFAHAAKFWSEAIETDPRLSQNPKNSHVYNAACSVSLTAAGKDLDNPSLDDAAKAKLRAQALGWLKADLAGWTKLLESGRAEDRTAMDKKLRHWKEDTDLATIRDPEPLAKLPEAERQEWQSLWTEVDALITRASKP